MPTGSITVGGFLCAGSLGPLLGVVFHISLRTRAIGTAGCPLIYVKQAILNCWNLDNVAQEMAFGLETPVTHSK